MATIRWRRGKDGRLWASVIWKDGSRKQHAKALGTTDRVVARGLFGAWLRENGQASRLGLPGPPGDFAVAREAFLATVALGAASPASTAFVRSKVEAIEGGMGGTPWPAWTVDRFRRWLGAQAWKPRTVAMHVGVARRFIRWARAEGYPCPDFAAGVKAPRVRMERPDVLTPEQMRALLEKAEGHALELAVHLACRGLSKGDLRTLEWSEVDLKGARVLRDRAKTGEALPIPLEGRLLEVVKRVKVRKGRVCPAVALEPHAGNEDRALRTLCRRADVPPCGWHRLRHSYATMLYAEGVDIPTLGRLLGHAPGSPVTLRYVHPDWEALRKAARKGEDRLK